MLRRTPLRAKRPTPRRKGKAAPRIKPGRVEDPAHLDQVRNLPCCICGTWPSEAHHIRDGQVGTGQKAGDDEAIPLCPWCHRIRGDSFHALGTTAWEAKFGAQRHHLTLTRARLASESTPET